MRNLQSLRTRFYLPTSKAVIDLTSEGGRRAGREEGGGENCRREGGEDTIKHFREIVGCDVHGLQHCAVVVETPLQHVRCCGPCGQQTCLCSMLVQEESGREEGGRGREGGSGEGREEGEEDREGGGEKREGREGREETLNSDIDDWTCVVEGHAEDEVNAAAKPQQEHKHK